MYTFIYIKCVWFWSKSSHGRNPFWGNLARQMWSMGMRCWNDAWRKWKVFGCEIFRHCSWLVMATYGNPVELHLVSIYLYINMCSISSNKHQVIACFDSHSKWPMVNQWQHIVCFHYCHATKTTPCSMRVIHQLLGCRYCSGFALYIGPFLILNMTASCLANWTEQQCWFSKSQSWIMSFDVVFFFFILCVQFSYCTGISLYLSRFSCLLLTLHVLVLLLLYAYWLMS